LRIHWTGLPAGKNYPEEESGRLIRFGYYRHIPELKELAPEWDNKPGFRVVIPLL
jgi:hypothetical protein